MSDLYPALQGSAHCVQFGCVYFNFFFDLPKMCTVIDRVLLKPAAADKSDFLFY